MNRRTIYYHTTEVGDELICPEDGQVIYEEHIGGYTVLGVLTADTNLLYGFRVWTFYDCRFYMFNMKIDGLTAKRDVALSHLKDAFDREVKSLR